MGLLEATSEAVARVEAAAKAKRNSCKGYGTASGFAYAGQRW